MRLSRSLRVVLGLATFIALVSVTSGVGAQARTFQVRNDGGSRIQFISDAPLETITGVSSNVSGEVTVDPANLSTARGRVAVQTSSLRTGIDLRDEHLRAENWIDAARYPEATFEVTRVEGAAALQANQPANVTVRGRFTLHGVTRDVAATGRVRWVPLTAEMRNVPGITGDVLRVQVRFKINLSDFNISIPAVVQLKVSNEIWINVNLRGVIAAPAAPAANSTARK